MILHAFIELRRAIKLIYEPGIRRPGYRFTKGLSQNLNLRTNLKLEYYIKPLIYIQQNSSFQASFLFYWTLSFTFLTW